MKTTVFFIFLGVTIVTTASFLNKSVDIIIKSPEAKIPLNGNLKSYNFSKAKTILMTKVYFDHFVTFYCRARFNSERKVIDLNNYLQVNRKNPRAQRIEWDHVVPVENFGRSFDQWRVGDKTCQSRKGRPFKGRRCATLTNPEFRRMEADLHNLVPAIGEINQRRSNYSFTNEETGRQPATDNRCDIDFMDKKVRPPRSRQGDIARIYLYMDWAYPKRTILSDKSRKMFIAWNKLDPPDSWECLRSQRIQQIQGNGNPFIKCPPNPRQ